jgi:Tfp pilus assembly protein PilZ
VRVRAWLSDGHHTVYLRLFNLSRGGLAVQAPTPFPVGGELQVSIELPKGRIRGRGQVVWVSTPGAGDHGPRMGAAFLSVDEGHDELAALVD